MSIARYLKNLGIIFPKDVSTENLKLLINLGCIPIIKYYDKYVSKYRLQFLTPYFFNTYVTCPVGSVSFADLRKILEYSYEFLNLPGYLELANQYGDLTFDIMSDFCYRYNNE